MFISTWRGFVEEDKNRNKVYYDGTTVLFNFSIMKILFFNAVFEETHPYNSQNTTKITNLNVVLNHFLKQVI